MIKNIKKITGISLLELMLSLGVIAILLIMATRYYLSTRSAQQINDAVRMVTNLTNAADNWYWTYKSYEQNPTSGKDISMGNLAAMGLVPQAAINSPWGGPVTINPRSANHVVIVIPNVPYEDNPPKGDCINLKEILAKQNINGDCTASGFIIVYP